MAATGRMSRSLDTKQVRVQNPLTLGQPKHRCNGGVLSRASDLERTRPFSRGRLLTESRAIVDR